MTEADRACEYLEAMAAKVGGDVRVFSNDKGKFTMHKRGKPEKSFKISLDEPREKFNEKVKILMEG